MMHKDIIHSLTDWIDRNLDKNLSIDEVAAKAGYPSGICSGCFAPSPCRRWAAISVNVG